MAEFVLSLFARKGGVGRTTHTQNIAGALAENNIKVLAIDLDSQASLSKNFFGRDIIAQLRPYETIAALYDQSREPDLQAIIRPTDIENIYLVPSADHLKPYDLPEPLIHGDLQYVIRDFVRDVDGYFDVVLIDTPPNIDNLPTWGALMASNFVLTPVQPEKNSIEAIVDVNMQVSNALSHGNSGLVQLGYFVTNLDRRSSIQKALERTARQLYGAQVFDTVLFARTAFKEAVYQYQPITHYKPKSDEAELVRSLLVEILQRIQTTGKVNDKQHANAG